MKKNSVTMTISIRQNTRSTLERQAKLNNQSMTKYIESLINKKEKFNPQIIKAINESYNVFNQHIANYNALNSATSNLNQLMYFLNINEFPTKEEINIIIETIRLNVDKNIKNTQIIINTLQPFINTKIKKHKRKSIKNIKNEDK